MKQKINLRLSLISLIAVIAATLGITSVYYNLFQVQVKNDLRTSAQLLSETEVFQSAYHSSGGSDPGDPDDATAEAVNAVLENLESDNLRITWIEDDGTVLYDNEAEASELSNHLDRPEIQEAIRNGEGESVRKSDTLQLDTFYYALKLDDGTILRVATRASSITSLFVTAFPVILIIIVLILGICILLGHFLTLQLMKPINQMAEHLDDNPEQPVYKELEPFADKIRSQHEKILEAATIRQDFTANISHELKTPLTAISGYAELIENHMIGAEQEEHIARQIRHNAERLLSLINDIIRLSELDHTEIPRHFIQVDLYAIAQECCQEMQMNAGQKQIYLECCGRTAFLSGERDLLKEMIENLVQNAIRYNHEGGRVQVLAYKEHDHAILEVRDNGIGIPKDKQERIFERFYRVDKSRSRETGGTGLGLAIVKHIAEIHSATITVNSEPGKGTTMQVSF